MTALSKTKRFVDEFANQKWTTLSSPFYFIFGFVWFVISLILYVLMYPFIPMSFNEYTTFYWDETVVMRGTDVFTYFFQLITGKRIKWLDEYMLNREYNEECIWEGKEYLCKVDGGYPLSNPDTVKILYDGAWHEVNFNEVEIC